MLAAVSCGGTSETPDAVTSTDSTSETTAVDNTPKLGFEAEDNGGRTFTILMPTHAAYEYDVEQTGDIVDDAVYNRNAAVEELLGINFDFVVSDGHWNQRTEFVNLIANDVLSGTGAYDLISGLLVAVAPSTQEGYYVEGNKLPYCDFSQPWWIQDMYDNFSIGGKLFEFVGDASLTVYKDLAVVYFNKQIFEDYSLENPYDLVRDGKWTIDKFIELASATGNDVNGDGKWDVTTDEFGCIIERMVLAKMEVAINEDPFVRGSDGSITLGSMSEKFIDTYEKIYNFVFNNDNVVSMNTHDDGTYLTAQYFGEGRFGMMLNFLKNTEMIRDMEDDFGILPMPKYDEKQEKYLSSLGTSVSVMLVPQTAKDITLTSKVMEALCYYSSLDVIPKYYEVALKEKYSRDDDIKEMLEIIRDGATMTFAQFNAQLIGDPLPFMGFIPSEPPTQPGELASTYESNVKKFQTTLDNVLEAYAALE